MREKDSAGRSDYTLGRDVTTRLHTGNNIDFRKKSRHASKRSTSTPLTTIAPLYWHEAGATTRVSS